MTKEELEKATGQELIDERNYCGVDGYYGVYLDNVNAEMLKRFNRLAELETRCNELFLQTCEQAELIEKMKCCRNCKNEGDYKEPYRYGTGWCNICKRHKVAKGNFDKWEIKENT